MPEYRDRGNGEAAYRCSECGRDEGLTAISYGYMEGILARDGSGLETHDYAEDNDLCVETVRCPDHPFAPIHRRVDGTWHRWEQCQAGGCRAGRVWNPYRGYVGCPACGGFGGIEVPVGASHA